MKLTQMKQVLASSQIRLTKSLGQNFLHDTNQLQRIARAAEIGRDQNILEIGPGLGPLTQILLDHGAKVLAIEIDRRLFEFLSRQFARHPDLTLLHADALDYLREHREWTGWKLVANLPYSIASPILVEMSQAAGKPERMVVTVQIEVAHKLMAAAGTPDFGLLTLLIQLRYRPAGWFRISASCFFPSPEIDSACVTLVRRDDPLLNLEEEPLFERIIRRAFSQRRKMMQKLLKQDWAESALHSAFHKVGLSPEIRAEKVRLEEFVQLTRELQREQDQPK